MSITEYIFRSFSLFVFHNKGFPFSLYLTFVLFHSMATGSIPPLLTLTLDADALPSFIPCFFEEQWLKVVSTCMLRNKRKQTCISQTRPCVPDHSTKEGLLNLVTVQTEKTPHLTDCNTLS